MDPLNKGTSFHNTTNETGQVLMNFEAKAQTQDQMVMEIFRANPTKPMAWFEVGALVKESIHEISLKRAITNNKNWGFLEKTSEKATSPYGSPCYRYKLKT